MSSNVSRFRVLFAGVGSGGHIYPLIAVYHSLKSYLEARGILLDARYFGNAKSYAPYLEREGVKTVSVMGSKLRRYGSIANLFAPFAFAFGFLQALIKIYFFMPDVVFSKGGPGAYAIILAARWYRVPVVIHESDAIAGITNRLSAKHAKVVCLSFEQAQSYFGSAKTHFVGTPVRKYLRLEESPATSRLALGLPDPLPTLFVVGGSQGAQALNNFILENAELLLAEFAIVHQVGPANYKAYKREFDFMSKNFNPELLKRYHAVAYLSDSEMATALNACDLVVSRAGSSIFEFAAMGKPAILVPIPTSANNHQRANAYAFSDHGAGLVIEEENLRPSLFIQQIKRLLADKNRLERMKMSAGTFYKPDAAERIAEDILSSSDIAGSLAGK
ncbi:MAG: UDP-N-acetylglucosamine--N-acetylmuramyl-(pentapeptide) pyrophosphoryl-undecaprenol N-acetylglucosamine transferase [Candidatus Paceibacterota bacterium]